MRLIEEQLGREAMGELIELFMVGDCEICGNPVEPGQERDTIEGRAVHQSCLFELEDA